METSPLSFKFSMAWVSIATDINDSRFSQRHLATQYALTITVVTAQAQSGVATSLTMTVGN